MKYVSNPAHFIIRSNGPLCCLVGKCVFLKSLVIGTNNVNWFPSNQNNVHIKNYL